MHVFNSLITLFLIVMYLVMPTAIFAQSGSSLEPRPSMNEAVCEAATTGNESPCSNEHGTTCCDSSFCCCACHAPLIQRVQLTYAPEIATQSFREPSWFTQQVYRSIFVPPQNLA